jgi:hypothetical protein
MDRATRALFDNLRSKDRLLQGNSFKRLVALTDNKVPWADEVWDELVEGLRHKDNHVRAISTQLLCNLAKSDPGRRILKDFPAILAVTKDKRFVTARHTLFNIWKIGRAGPEQRRMVVDGLERRFKECIKEKNCTLIRYDITQGFKNLYEATSDESIKQRSLALIETEKDLKYKKKYGTLWRARRKS